MSKLFGLGRAASELVRKAKDRNIDRKRPMSDYVRSRARVLTSLLDLLSGSRQSRPNQRPPQPPRPPGDSDQRSGAPPVTSGFGVPPTPPRPPEPPAGVPGDEEFDNIQLLGRDASYDPEDWRVVMEGMRLTPGSSNVYGYYFESESRTHGILYVTFLREHSDGKREGPGTTYGYYSVPASKYHEFKKASAASAGKAVWDYLRVRGTVYAHQHNYRLIQAIGEYVPRKATRRGFRTRNLPDPGVGRRSFRRSTLPERLFAAPDRGEPDRGEPDRGRPG